MNKKAVQFFWTVFLFLKDRANQLRQGKAKTLVAAYPPGNSKRKEAMEKPVSKFKLNHYQA